MKIGILGAGRWASYLAWYLARQNHQVMIWGKSTSSTYQSLRDTYQNEYLSLDPSTLFTDHLDEVLAYGDTIIIAIASQGVRELAKDIQKRSVLKKTFILAMKGLEADSGKRLSEVFLEEVKQKCDLAVWVGPTQVEDAIQGTPNCMVIAATNLDVATRLATQLGSTSLRLYTSSDLIGCEIGAALKNVIGIMAGVLDGLKLSSLKGALMARGAYEVARIVTRLGGNAETVYGLSHLGDYEATLFSRYSHNRAFGESFVRGLPYEKLAEGVYTTKAIHELCQKMNLEIPLINAAYNCLYHQMDVQLAIDQLFTRDLKEEFS